MRRTLSLCLLVVSCILSVAEAGQANRCRRACRAAVDDCVATTHRRRACKKQLIRACRQHGVAACDITPPTTTLPPPSTTTTTTFPALPTTSSTSTTTTTTSVTTTLPVRDYTGAWTFVGTLAEDSCGAGPGLAETFVISQSGTALEVTVESLPGVTLGGQATGDGFQVSGTFVAAGCTVEVALTAYNDGTVVLTAGTGLDFDCPFAPPCRSIWAGTLTLSGPTTTVTVSTTTTSTNSTSTTSPVVRDYGGDWTFVGSLAADTCGSSTGLTETFHVSQSGTALNVTVGSLPGVILQGSATSIGFQVFGSFLDSGCTVALVLVAQNDGTVTLTASTGFDIDCGFTSCDSIWVGTLSR